MLEKTIKNKIQTILANLLLPAAFLAFVAAGQVWADVNPLIGFGGKVTELDGSELPDGNYDMSFRLFNSPTGAVSLWSEDLTAATRFAATLTSVSVEADRVVYGYASASATSTLRVGQYLTNETTGDTALIIDFDHSLNTVSVNGGANVWSSGDQVNNRPFVEGGIIQENLGTVNPLNIDFDGVYYLEVVFNGETMQPRKMIVPSAQALNSDRLGGLDSGEYAILADNETITGRWSFTDIVDISASSSQPVLTINQTGSGNILEVRRNASISLAVNADGRVQIGNYYFPLTAGSPGHILKSDLAGNLYWAPDIAGIGEGAVWATSSDNLVLYPTDTSHVVVIGNIATSAPGHVFEVEGASYFDQLTLSSQNLLRFNDADNSNFVALRASSSLAGNLILTLPVDAGSPGQVLFTDGSGHMYWGNQTSITYVNEGLAGQMPYYAANGSTLTGTSTIYLTNEGYFGIGTSTPSAQLTVGGISGNQFIVDDYFIMSSGGSWATRSTSSVRTTLGLADAFTYSPYMIDSAGSYGQLWMSDQDGRGRWSATSSLGPGLGHPHPFHR
jgi:hypothetical protein